MFFKITDVKSADEKWKVKASHGPLAKRSLRSMQKIICCGNNTLEALDGKMVGAAAKKRLKSATRNILLAGKVSRSARATKRPVKRKNGTHAVGRGKRGMLDIFPKNTKPDQFETRA